MIDKRLFGLLGKNKVYIFLAVALSVVGLATSITVTACICRLAAVAYARSNALSDYLVPICAAVAAMLVRYLASRASSEVKDTLGRRVKGELREKIYRKLTRLGVGCADGMSMAGLTQLSLEGVEQLDLYYSSYIPQLFYALAAPVILFFVTVRLDARVAAVLLACVPLIPLSIIAVSKYAKRIFQKYWGKYTSMGDGFLDSVQGLRELKLFCADERQQEKLMQTSEEFRRITMKVLVMQLASTTVMDLVAYGASAVGISLAVHDAARGAISPFTALFLILVAVEFFLPLRAFGSAFHIAMNGASAGSRILELLETPEPTWGTETPGDTELRLDGVSFSYDGKREVLQDVSMVFPRRGMTAIVGSSGCGKSTVVKLLIGAVRPMSGQVFVGEDEIFSLSREKYYDTLSLVSCDSYVFNTSVKENFRTIKEAITDEEILSALKRVQLDELGADENGEWRMISEDGVNISGGQKQRLTMAAQLTKKHGIYIFDEATSNIDIESERVIFDAIKALASESSVIVISHRLANVTEADKIYYMEDGRVAECGAHDELLRLNGGYARLYRTQKALEEAGSAAEVTP